MVVVEQDDSDFKQGYFGEMTKATRNFISSSWDNISSSAFGETAKNIFEKTTQLISSAFENEHFRKLKSSVRASRNTVDDNAFLYLNDIGQLQHAPSAMHHLMMANPFVRNLYHKGVVDGYSDTYDDVDPGCIGEDHVHYRLATNGIVVRDPKDGLYYSTSYSDEELDNYEELDIVQQSMIQHAWSQCNAYLSLGNDDPTSRYNSSLSRRWTSDIADLYE